jgi:Protein of unknown function (DUF2867)
VCDTYRGSVGLLRGYWSGKRGAAGYVTKSDNAYTVVELKEVPANSILRQKIKLDDSHHNDTFMLSLEGPNFSSLSASKIMELLLEGFLNNAPKGVASLMTIRNFLVKPMGLRTSPLGCPSSDGDGNHVQVMLGANDKHLTFRSAVSVEKLGPQRVNITLGTSVICKNLFGRFYMSAISYVHRKYVSPTMLSDAASYLASRVF